METCIYRLICAIVETEKSHNIPSTCWTPKEAIEEIQVQKPDEGNWWSRQAPESPQTGMPSAGANVQSQQLVKGKWYLSLCESLKDSQMFVHIGGGLCTLRRSLIQKPSYPEVPWQTHWKKDSTGHLWPPNWYMITVTVRSLTPRVFFPREEIHTTRQESPVDEIFTCLPFRWSRLPVWAFGI